MTLRECIDLLFEDTDSSFAYSLAKELQTNLSNSKGKILIMDLYKILSETV